MQICNFSFQDNGKKSINIPIKSLFLALVASKYKIYYHVGLKTFYEKSSFSRCVSIIVIWRGILYQSVPDVVHETDLIWRFLHETHCIVEGFFLFIPGKILFPLNSLLISKIDKRSSVAIHVSWVRSSLDIFRLSFHVRHLLALRTLELGKIIRLRTVFESKKKLFIYAPFF